MAMISKVSRSWEQILKDNRVHCLHSEVFPHEGLAELPIGGRDVPGGGSASITARDPEGKRLTSEDRV